MIIDLLPLFLTLLIAGALAGITAGLFGNGGGFVVVPALVFVFSILADPASDLIFVAIGTSLATIVISSARSVIAHRARGAVDFEVVRSWAPWLLVGVGVGLYLASFARPNQLYSVFAGGVLVYSIYFLFPKALSNMTFSETMPTGLTRATIASVLGGFSALLGIGGGTPTVITMVACSKPIYQAVATARGAGFISGLGGAVGFLILGLGKSDLPVGSMGYINVPSLIAMGVMSLFTAPIGAKWAHSLDEDVLKRLFGIYLVAVSLSMFWKASQV